MLVLRSIKTKGNKALAVAQLVNFRIGSGSAKYTAYIIQITAQNCFVICMLPATIHKDKPPRYIGRVEFVEVRLALPDTIIYQKNDDIEFGVI